jgi:hypothetical protein
LLRSLYNFDKLAYSLSRSSFPFIEFSLLFILKNHSIAIKKMNIITIIYICEKKMLFQKRES